MDAIDKVQGWALEQGRKKALEETLRELEHINKTEVYGWRAIDRMKDWITKRLQEES